MGLWETILNFIGSILQKIFKIKPSNALGSDDAIHTTSFKVLCCCFFDNVSSTKAFNLFFQLRRKVRQFVETNLFRNFILVAIFFNSLFLAVEHHNQVKIKPKINY